MTAYTFRSRFLFAALRWLAAALSGWLLILCFPPYHQGWLAWVALTPLVAALTYAAPERSAWSHFGLGMLTGAVFFPGTFYWLYTLGLLFGGAGLYGIPVYLGLYLALYFGFWGWFFGSVLLSGSYAFSSSARNLGIGALAAAAWITHEWVRGWLFSGFGWNALGVTLRDDLPMIQIADLTGVFGLSGLVVFVNVMLVVIVRRLVSEIGGPLFLKRIRWEFSATMLVVCAVFSYGVRALFHEPVYPQVTLKVAVLQPNIPEQDKKFGSGEVEDQILAKLARLHSQAAVLEPDLIVWPEASVPRGVMADQENQKFVHEQAELGDFSLLLGTLDYDLSPTGSGQELVYNSAMLFTGRGTAHQTYRKMHLVPYGEYLPLRPFLPEFIADLVPGDLAFGQGVKVFQLPKPALRLAPLICFEDTLGALTGEFVRAGADLLVNVTNDAWFVQSAGAEQHLGNAVLRAVEMRRPLLRATNTGITCLVDPQGKVDRFGMQPFTVGSVTHVISVATGVPVTFYARFGDWIAHLAALLTGCWLLRAGLLRRRRTVH